MSWKYRGTPIPEFDAETLQRFWAQVNKTETCWLWTGFCCPKGYGSFFHKIANRKTANLRAHRVTLAMSSGDDTSKIVDHVCRVRNCVNPAHLRRVTQRENTLENSLSIPAINKMKTHCTKGHPLFGDNLRIYLRRGKEVRLCRKCEWETQRRTGKRRTEKLRALRRERKSP